MADGDFSIRRQCELLGLNRSAIYYEPRPVSSLTITLMNLLDEQYTRTPCYGVRKMTECLQRRGYDVGKCRVRRLLRRMGLEAIYPKKRLSIPGNDHRIYPYLLRGVLIVRPDQVWSADITYVRLLHGFVYLVAIIDWYSRSVLSWRLSNTLDAGFCLDALDEALCRAQPDIFNTDQGTQFTSESFIERLQSQEVTISMDGRGRVFDNIFVERLWRTVKYENIYLKGYETVRDVEQGLTEYFHFYNTERIHQSLQYKTPQEVYKGMYRVAA